MSLLATTGFAGDSQLLTIEPPGRAIRVRLYDYAKVPPAVLDRARATATEILEQAGVALEWVECRLRLEDPPKDTVCEAPGTPMDLYLHILDLAMAKRAGGSRGCLGVALLAEGFDSTASVYSHRALELEKENRGPRAAILGAMMAHEIGHLLLDQSSHAAKGIMRAQWGDQDLKQISRGRMWFTAEQATRIASLVEQRERAQRSIAPSLKITLVDTTLKILLDARISTLAPSGSRRAGDVPLRGWGLRCETAAIGFK